MTPDASAGTPTILVVASWYPSVDSLTTGRFIADQVTLLASAGSFAPVIASFDPLALWGSGSLRRREASAVLAFGAAGTAGHPSATFRNPRAGLPGSVPVAWLPVPGVAGGTWPADRSVSARVMALAGAAAAVDSVAGRPALIHAHTGYPDGAAAAAEAARRGVPLVITEHASFLATILREPVMRRHYRAAGLAASRIIAVGTVLANQIRSELPELAERVVVIPNIVDVDRFAGAAAEVRRDGELLYVGNRKPAKGIGLLLDAFAIAHAARPSLRLRLVGAAPEALDQTWRRRARALGIADAVAFEPEADRAGVAAAMARASLFVHPSARETFGAVAAEALAAGLPVVAVDSGGVPEVLGPDPNQRGAVVAAGDPGLLADAILGTLDRLADMRPERLRDYAAARFGPAAVLDRLTALYREAIAEGPRPSSPAARRRPVPGTPARTMSSTPCRSPALKQSEPDIVIVGLDRARAARIVAALGPGERGRCWLVTGDGDFPALPDGLAGVRTVPGLAARHAARQAVADTAAGVAGGRSKRQALLSRPAVIVRELWQWRARHERTLLAAATSAIESVASPGAALVVLDGFDALAAEPLVSSGRLRPLPGAGRWLAGDPSATRTAGS